LVTIVKNKNFISRHKINNFFKSGIWIEWNCQNNTVIINFLFLLWHSLSNELLYLDNYLILSSLCISEIKKIVVKWDLKINLIIEYGCTKRTYVWEKTVLLSLKKNERKRSSRKLGISERNKMRETQRSTWNMTI
jgi:hypothetical protein